MTYTSMARLWHIRRAWAPRLPRRRPSFVILFADAHNGHRRRRQRHQLFVGFQRQPARCDRSARQHDCLLTYNGYNEMTDKTDPLGIQTAFNYDTAGNLTSKVVTTLSLLVFDELHKNHHLLPVRVIDLFRPMERPTRRASSNRSLTPAAIRPPMATTPLWRIQNISRDILGDKTVDAYDSIGRLYCTVAPEQVAPPATTLVLLLPMRTRPMNPGPLVTPSTIRITF